MGPSGHARFTLKKNPKEEMGRTREEPTRREEPVKEEEEEQEDMQITWHKLEVHHQLLMHLHMHH